MIDFTILLVAEMVILSSLLWLIGMAAVGLHEQDTPIDDFSDYEAGHPHILREWTLFLEDCPAYWLVTLVSKYPLSGLTHL